jgi:hypothetical protein
MRSDSIRPTLLTLVAVLALGLPSAASADEAGGSCSYEDLRGQFTLTVACDALQNYSGNSQAMKRLWLNGPLGEVHVMEAPEPYQTAPLDVLLKTLGRHWTDRRSAAVRSVKVGESDALVTTRRRTRISSRTLIFKLADRNLTARLAVVVARKDADAALDKLEAAFLAGFSAKVAEAE